MTPEFSPKVPRSEERDLNALVVIADGLYSREATHQDFFNTFSKNELMLLWEATSGPEADHGWDDEVYDALSDHGYFSEPSLDVKAMSEPELIELVTNLPSAIEPLGKLAMDEYMMRRGEVIGQAMASRRLEESIKDKFAHLTDQALVSRMSRAPDFGYDDEEVELTRRLKLGGAAWRWSNDFFNPKIEIYKPDATPDV